MVSPVAPTVAFEIGAKVDDPLQMYLIDVFTVSLNLAGICGISVPCGFSEGMPVGLQIIGPALGETAILRAAYHYEQATEWHKQKPGAVRRGQGGEEARGGVVNFEGVFQMNEVQTFGLLLKQGQPYTPRYQKGERFRSLSSSNSSAKSR